jgi:C-terminal processing protease CtpA/Prc
VTPRDIYSILEDRQIPFDPKAVQQAAAEAMLKVIDPQARIFKPADATESATPTPAPHLESWPEGIGYLKIHGFVPAKPPGVSTSETSLLKQVAETSLAGLIVDLRGAGGTDLESAAELASILAATNGPLFAIRDGRGRLQGFPASPGSTNPLVLPPIMIAVDSDTRESAEAVAAILKSNPRILLIGGPTRGDLVLRERIRVPSGDYLYLATRWMLHPDGTPFVPGGIRPDIEVTTYTLAPLPTERPPIGRTLSEKSRQDRVLLERVSGDAVLAKAVDILLALKALGIHAPATNHSN